MDVNTSDIVGLIEALGLTGFVRIGHSMGGTFGLAVAARLAVNGESTPAPLAPH